MSSKSDQAVIKSIIKALSLPIPYNDPSKISFTSHGGSGFTKTGHLRVVVPSENKSKDGEEERHYFIKTSPSLPASSSARDNVEPEAEMFQGECASLNAIADAVPGFCPRAVAWGSIKADDDEEGKGTKLGWFLATEFLNLRASGHAVGEGEGYTLAERLGKLHSTPAPPPPSDDEVGDMIRKGLVINRREVHKDGNKMAAERPQFGFPVATFCGDVKQPNHFRRSWADFYANQRLRTVLAESEKRNGSYKALRDLVERTAEEVVPRLLGDGHLGYDKHGKGEGIVPVIVHGDLWCGNTSTGKILANGNEEDGKVGDMVYDPSACYAHSEFELGIMKMFGGFNGHFYKEYHRRVPKTEPVEEYEDRVALYELYHQLNHHAIFGAGYDSSAMAAMRKLLKKYGD